MEKDKNSPACRSPEGMLWGRLHLFLLLPGWGNNSDVQVLCKTPGFGRDGHLPVVPMWTILWSMGPSAPKAKNMARFPHRAAPHANTHNKKSLSVPFNERHGAVYNSYGLAALTGGLEVD